MAGASDGDLLRWRLRRWEQRAQWAKSRVSGISAGFVEVCRDGDEVWDVSVKGMSQIETGGGKEADRVICDGNIGLILLQYRRKTELGPEKERAEQPVNWLSTNESTASRQRIVQNKLMCGGEGVSTIQTVFYTTAAPSKKRSEDAKCYARLCC